MDDRGCGIAGAVVVFCNEASQSQRLCQYLLNFDKHEMSLADSRNYRSRAHRAMRLCIPTSRGKRTCVS